MTSALENVLVVTVRKSFWASEEAKAFPRRIDARVFYGHSTNLLNSAAVTLRALLAIVARPPRVVVLGSVERAVPWFIRARRLGLLRNSKLVVTNQLHLDREQLLQVDRNVVYSRAWIDRQPTEVRRRAVFAPLPADGRVDVRADSTAAGTYVFTGGGTGRDFASVIEAVRGTGLELEIVTFSPATLGWDGELPANCRVRWRMPVDAFVDRIARALFVVVPLRDAESDFGQTTVVQALSAGKAVVATRSLGIVDYVEDGREGFLVEAGDVGAYRAAILRLARDPKLRSACELNARRRAELLTYAEFGVRLRSLCEELLRVDHDAA